MIQGGEAFISFTRACALKILRWLIPYFMHNVINVMSCVLMMPSLTLWWSFMMIMLNEDIFEWYLHDQQVVYPWEVECACLSFHTRMACPITEAVRIKILRNFHDSNIILSFAYLFHRFEVEIAEFVDVFGLISENLSCEVV